MWTLLFSQVILERNFPKESNLRQNLIFQIREASPLGARDYLYVGFNSGGSGLEPGTVSGHCWEERGSSQVIWLIDLRSKITSFY